MEWEEGDFVCPSMVVELYVRHNWVLAVERIYVGEGSAFILISGGQMQTPPRGSKASLVVAILNSCEQWRGPNCALCLIIII